MVLVRYRPLLHCLLLLYTIFLAIPEDATDQILEVTAGKIGTHMWDISVATLLSDSFLIVSTKLVTNEYFA